MFKLKQSSTFTWPVRIKVPTNGGNYDEQTFDAEFRRLPRPDLEAMFARAATDEEVARAAVVGWAGVVDETGAPVPFSEAAFTAALAVPGVATTIARTFLEALLGVARKN